MRGKTQQNKRRDKGNLVSRKGESQRANGGYDYRWTDQKGKRHSIYRHFKAFQNLGTSLPAFYVPRA